MSERNYDMEMGQLLAEVGHKHVITKLFEAEIEQHVANFKALVKERDAVKAATAAQPAPEVSNTSAD